MSGNGLIAIISDIHANLLALETVLADIERQGIKRILCLGDIIGYGPDPAECLEKAKSFEISLMGNHEEAVLTGAFGFNPQAKESIDWTRDQLKPKWHSMPDVIERWELVRSLPLSYSEDDLLFVHGSPRDPTMEYVLKTDTEDLFGEVPEKIRSIFEQVRHICFIGHTHAPGIITEDGQFLMPDEFGMRYTFEPRSRYVVNVGSVGQPRDRNNKACYTTLDGATLEYHRLEYDFQKTADKIRTIDRLDDRNAERLETGC